MRLVRPALLALILSAVSAAPAAAAIEDGDVTLARQGGDVIASFTGVSRRDWQRGIAAEQLRLSCVGRESSRGAERPAPPRRHSVRFADAARGMDWCVLRVGEPPGQELAVRGFTAEGRRLVDERAAAQHAVIALDAFVSSREQLGRYPTDEELTAFSQDADGIPIVRLAAPDAPPPATGAGVFLDASTDRVLAVALGGGRTVFFEHVGLGESATFSTNALRWYVELVAGDAD